MEKKDVDTRMSDDGMTFTVSVNGDFSFALLHEFKKAYGTDEASSAKNIILDMRMTDTVDSSALGMLLNMQKDLNKADGEIHVINCNKFVGNILNITSFNKKFSID